MSCKFYAKTNNNESQLYKDILEVFSIDEPGQEKTYMVTMADATYRMLYKGDEVSPRIKKFFGDFLKAHNEGYVDDPLMDAVTDENGEPRLYSDNNGGHYIKSPDGKKLYITGPFSTLSPIEVNDITHNIAYDIYDSIRNESNFITRQDFEEFVSDHSIMEYVEKFIEEQTNIVEQLIEEGNEEEALQMADTLQKIHYYKEDFAHRIKDFFLAKGVDIKAQEATDVVDEQGDIIYDKASFEINSKDRATFNIKLMLSFIVDESAESTHGHKFKEFDSVWGFLEPKLAGFTSTMDEDGEITSVLDKQLGALEPFRSYLPWVDDLVATIKESPIHLQRQFALAFDKEPTNFKANLFDTEKKLWRNINAQQNSPADTLIDRWYSNFLDSKYVNFQKQTRDDESLAELKDIAYAAIKTENPAALKAILAEIGIYVNDRTIEHMIDERGYRSVADSIAKVIRSVSNKPLLDKKNDEFKNLFKDQKKAFLGPLAELQTEIEGDLQENTILVGTKQYWQYANFSVLSDMIARIKDGDVSLLEELQQQHPNSTWIQEIMKNLGNEEWLKEFSVGIFSSFRLSKKGDKASTSKDVTQNDLLAVQISEMLKTVMYKDKTTSTFPMLTMGDKSVVRKLVGFTLHKNTGNLEKNSIPKRIVDIFEGYFIDELNRIDREWKKLFDKDEMISEKERVVHYHTDKQGNVIKVGDRFFGGGEENLREAMEYAEENNLRLNFLGNALKFQIFDMSSMETELLRSNGKPFLLSDDVRADVRAKIRQDIMDKAKASIKAIKKRGINENNLDAETLKQYKDLDHALLDFAINGRIANIESTKLFYGDAAYFKNPVEINKRAQALAIDGLRLSVGETKGDHIFRAAVVTDVDNFQSNYLDDIREAFPDSPEVVDSYAAVNRTDAQAWITPERWKFIVERLGRWNDNFQKIYDKIEANQNLTHEEFKVMTMTMQPLKGVYYGIHNGRPVYLKYSQAVLIPNIAKSNGMGRLLERMRKDKVDEVITLDGVKVGALQTTKIANEDMTDIAENLEELNGFELDNRNWRLQQDLPSKGIKETKIGSQLMKNILVNFNAKEMEDIGGQSLMDDIMKWVSNLSDIEVQDIKKELGMDKDGIIKKDRLNKIIIQQLKERNAGRNIIEALEKDIPYEAIPQHLSRIENILFSFVRSRTTKLQTLGGGLIQVSSFGFERLTKSEKNGITYLVGDEDVKRINETGLAMPTKGKPGEVFIGAPFIEKHIPGWRNMTRDELFKIVDKKLFDIVGYRIPNQGMSSNDNLRVVGILPDHMGDTIIPYAEITAKTGSDFDIDKMYIMMPEYKAIPEDNWYDKAKKLYNQQRDMYDGKMTYESMMVAIHEYDPFWQPNEEDFEGTDGSYETIFQSVLKGQQVGGKQFASALFKWVELYHSDKIKTKTLKYATKGRSGIKNKLIDAYWKILNHPVNYQEKMQPVDATFLKDSVEDLWKIKSNKRDEGLDFYDPVNQLITKYNYLNGKSSLGAVANHLVDHPLAQIANLAISSESAGYFDVSGKLAGDLRISQILSSFLNAFVDIAKDDYIVRGNHNLVTNNVAMLLIRSGYDIDTVNAFLMQDILFDYVEEVKLQDSKVFRKFFEDKTRATPLETLIARYKGSEGEIYNNDPNIVNLDTIEPLELDNKEVLIDQLKHATPETQLRVLATFVKLQEPAANLRKAMASTKQDVEGAGNDLATLWTAQDAVIELMLGDEVINYSDKFEKTYFKSLYQNSVELLNDITRNQFGFASNYRGLVNRVLSAVDKYPTGDHQTMRDVIGFGRAMFYSKIPALHHMNPIELFTDLPYQVKEIRKLTNNFFLNNLKIEFTKDYGFIYVNQVRKDTPVYRDAMYEGWLELMQIAPELATDLVKHAFYSTGFTSSIKSLVPYIPHQWMFESGFVNQVVAENNNLQEAVMDDYIDIFLRNNYNNSSLVRTIPPTAKKMYRSAKGILILKDGTMFNKEDIPPYMVKINTAKGPVIFRLKSYSGNKKFNKYTATYQQVEKLGYYNKNGNSIIEFEKRTEINETLAEDTFPPFPYNPLGEYSRLRIGTLIGSAEDTHGNNPQTQRKPAEVAKSVNPDIEGIIQTELDFIEQESLSKPKTGEDLLDLLDEMSIEEYITRRLENVIKPSAKKYLPKEKAKSAKSNKYIGDGAPDSSTDRYKKLYEEVGRANVEEYEPTDIVWVSSNGARNNRISPVDENGNLQGVYTLIQDAIDAGASIVMDTDTHISKTKKYNIGEVALDKWMKENTNYIKRGNTWSRSLGVAGSIPDIKLDIEDESTETPDDQYQRESIYRAKERLLRLFEAEKGKFIRIRNEGTLQNLRTSVRMVNKIFTDNKIEIVLTSDGRSAMLKISPFDRVNARYQRNLHEKLPQQRVSENTIVNVSDVQDQINYLSEKFNAIVILDESLEEGVSGVLLGSNHPLTKKYGKPVIKINPNLLFGDTVIHEFAHLYIDLLGGLDNSRIAAAVAYLKTSPIWAEVQELYPELNDNMLAKEVLATALGREGAEIFQSQSKQTWWTRFKNWFFNLLSIRIQQREDIIRELAKEIISDTVIPVDINDLSLEEQHRKSIRSQLQDQRIDTKEKLVGRAFELLNKKMHNLRSLKYSKDGQKIQNESLTKLSNLVDELDKLRDVDQEFAMEKFAAYVIDNVRNIEQSFNEQLKEGSLTASYLNSMNNYLSAYKEIYNHSTRLIDNQETLAKLQDANTIVNNLLDKRWIQVKKFLVEKMSSYALRIHLEYKERFEVEANELGLKGAEKEEYIANKLAESQEAIQAEEMSRWYDKIEQGDFDIGTMEMWLRDPKSINSEIINIASIMIDKADQSVRNVVNNIRREITQEFEEYKKHHYNSDPEKMYANLVEKDSEGNWYLKDSVKPEFYLTYSKLKKEERAAYVRFGSGNKEYQKAAKALKEFNNNEFDIFGFPVDKWQNKNWKESLTKAELRFLNYLKKRLTQDDERLSNSKQLIKTVNSFKFYMLPKIGKTQFENLVSGDFVEAAKLDKFYKKKSDDTEYGDVNEEKNDKGEFSNVHTDHVGTVQQTVPIFFRRNLVNQKQSLDLPSIFLLNSWTSTNHKRKRDVAPTLELIAEMVGHEDRKYYYTSGILGRYYTGENGKLAMKKSEKEYKALMSTIENRIYSIKEIPSGVMNKISGQLAGYTGAVLLGFNYVSGIINVFQGKIQQLIETVGSPYLTKEGFLKAEAQFARDFGNIASATGTLNQNSKTMLLLDKFKGLADYKVLRNAFARDSRLKALISSKNISFLMEGGEFYMQATLMYAILNEIKVMNKKGEYIDRQGKVTTKEKAMSLADAYTVKDDKLVLDKNVSYHSFSPQHNIRNPKEKLDAEVAVTNLIGKTKNKLFGQYDKEMKALAERYWWGKLAFMFRRFIVPGFDRRWRSSNTSFKKKEDLEHGDRFVDYDLKSFDEGMYTSALRFLATIVRAMRELKLGVASVQHAWNQMTDMEKSNIYKTIADLSSMGLFFVIAAVFKNMGDGEPDEKTQTWLFWVAFMAKRLTAELAFFLFPTETLRILHNPAVSMSMIEKIGAFGEQVAIDVFSGEFEEYDRGTYKGQSKAGKKFKDVLPVIRYLEYDVREKMKWYYR